MNTEHRLFIKNAIQRLHLQYRLNIIVRVVRSFVCGARTLKVGCIVVGTDNDAAE